MRGDTSRIFRTCDLSCIVPSVRFPIPPMPLSNEQFGAWLKELRSNAGLSQAKLAGELEVDRSRVIAWEKGRNVPGGRHLIEIFRACRVGLEDGTADFPEAEQRPSTLAAVEQAIRVAHDDPEAGEDLEALAIALQRLGQLTALLAERLGDAQSRRSQPQ